MLHSLGLQYDELEDRLILVITVKQAETLVDQTLWLTRRISLNLRHQLEHLKKLAPVVSRAIDAQAQAATAEINHEVQAQQARVKRETQPTRPFNRAAAVLVKATACTYNPTAVQGSIRFEFVKGGPLTLNLSEPSLHGFIRVIDNNLQRAQWATAPEAGAATTPPAARAAGPIH